MWAFRVVLTVGAMLLGSCAVIDSQLDPRNATINKATDNARNNEILLNIVRASRSQPLNFVPISKASGTQMTDLKVGLPTLTLGPEQSAMQRQVVFGGNTWDNSANGSFDSAPLATHDFYANMLSPVQLETLNALIHQGFSRELVMYATIGAIRVEGPNGVFELKNDPAGEPDENTCPAAHSNYGPSGSLKASPYYPSSSSKISQSCEYHLFEFFLEAAMVWGFNVETTEIKNPAYTDDAVKKAKAAGKDPPPKTITQSRFCFDPAYTIQEEKRHVMGMADRCGSSAAWKVGPDQKDLQVQFGNNRAPKFKFTIIPRSPFAVFRYFGQVLRAQESVPVRLYWRGREARFDDDDRILTVSQSQIGPCFAHTSYFGRFYCVPFEGSDTTKQVFAMLAQMVALSTTSGSLPTTLEVRLQ